MAATHPSSARSSRSRSGVKYAAVLAGAAIALAVAGCGADDEEQSSGLSREQLIAQAAAICKRHSEVITAASTKVLAGGKLPDPRAFGRFAQQTIVPETTAQTRELRALQPADDVAAEYRAWLDASDATVAKIKQDPATVTDAANFKAVNAQADNLGVSKQCHIGPS